MIHTSGNDYHIQNRPPPVRLPFEDGGPPPVDIADVGYTLWKLAQAGMGAFAGTLTGLLLGGTLLAVIGSVDSYLGLFVLSFGFWGILFAPVVVGLVCGILVWKDLSRREAAPSTADGIYGHGHTRGQKRRQAHCLIARRRTGRSDRVTLQKG